MSKPAEVGEVSAIYHSTVNKATVTKPGSDAVKPTLFHSEWTSEMGLNGSLHGKWCQGIISRGTQDKMKNRFRMLFAASFVFVAQWE